jgi:plasmid maintenance system killer protein
MKERWTRRRGQKHKQLLDDIKENRRYWYRILINQQYHISITYRCSIGIPQHVSVL